MSKPQVVECQKCENHYLETTVFIKACPFCGNKDTQETIYLSPDGKMYWEGLAKLQGES